jgi:RNA 2',3'-cyclic 3'-phosphodiesterase
MQKKKIFIEITVPQQLRKRLVQKTSQWSDLPVKWLKEENLHITVSFIGYVDESVIPDICQKINEAVNNFESFEIVFDKIEFGPDAENPKIIWLIGEPSADLGKLNEAVEQALGMRPQEHKEYRPHITIGRIRKLKWDELYEKPIISEKYNVTMTVDSVSVMESKGGGAEYNVLEECPLM